MPHRLVLVTGATGKQGQSVIAALQPPTSADTASQNEPENTPDFQILALTRSPSSETAQTLVKTYKNVTLVQGDLDDTESIREIFEEYKSSGGIWGVFSVQTYPGLGADASGEERQGKNIASISHEYKVSCFIYSSSDRGDEREDDKLSINKSRVAKVNIEKHVMELGKQGLPWTILRPVFFMEIFEGTVGWLTAGVFKAGLKPDAALQLVAAQDIGRAAAAAFKNPASYHQQVLILISDRYTLSALNEAHIRATASVNNGKEGQNLPALHWVGGWFIIRMNKWLGHFISETNHLSLVTSPSHLSTDPELASIREEQIKNGRRAVPNPVSFEEWVKGKTSKTKAKNGETENAEKSGWNRVSIWGLITGKS
ncbi:hypothetical protein VKT23_014464 [Stygiomarasmius scandens]|uniref:NmrA-like domain-containing protein n=1 Tax=Marasmiellus scandens TaxID=2682957 RepID=A0ABR1J014_9AGAR